MRALRELATRQQGAVARAQALAAGFSSSGIARRLKAGDWKAVEDGVYLLPGFAPGWLQSGWAACLATGGIASHFTAARLWRLELPRSRGTGRLEVLVHAGRRPRSTRFLRVYRTRARVEPVAVQGVPAVELGPTLIQLGGALGARALHRAVDSASLLRPGILFWLADTLVASRRGHSSSPRFRALLTELLPDEGQPERAARLLARAHLVPGLRRHRGLDFAWPTQRVGLQLFDHQAHGRGDELAQLEQEGWRVLVTHERELQQRPRALIQRVREALRAGAD